MKEQAQAILVHRVSLGKQKRSANKAAQALTQNIVQPFDAARLRFTLTRRTVLVLRKNVRVRLPKVREQEALLVSLGDMLPQQAAGGFTSVGDGTGYNLARHSVLSQPQPEFVPTLADKRPHFVEFKWGAFLAPTSAS